MTHYGQSRNKQLLWIAVFSFGILTFLLMASKSPNLPSALLNIGLERDEHSLAATDGRPDTEEAGIAAAKEDIMAGKPTFILFGLITSEIFSSLNSNKVDYRLGGCVLDGAGYRFWQGYNDEIIRQGLVKN
jgi:uncharacterized membrane protein